MHGNLVCLRRTQPDMPGENAARQVHTHPYQDAHRQEHHRRPHPRRVELRARHHVTKPSSPREAIPLAHATGLPSRDQPAFYGGQLIDEGRR